jgi:hypothetical protein
MEKDTYPALNTREFVAKWQSVVEEHIVAELADLLPALAVQSSGNTLGPEQRVALSRHLAYALQVAGSDSGGLQAAVEYLRQAATTADEGPAIN